MTELGGSNPGLSAVVPGRDGAVVTLGWAAATDVGLRRAVNEDSFVATSPIFAVADGMGGHSAGDLASGIVVQRLSEMVGDGFGASRAIDRALQAATDDISAIAADTELGVGTTVTGALLTLQDDEPFFAIFNIGDSRVYAFEHNELVQVTVDHSVVQELVEAGTLTRDEADHHPDSNIITRAVGFNSTPAPDYWMVPVRTGLRLLLCSDGLTKELSDERIRLHLASGLSPETTVAALVDAALAAGGRDNITTIVLDVLDAPVAGPEEDTEPRSAR
ncbi:MAG: protein phosphatase 2C domain-containing protein [Rhodoglobus sp.]